MILKIKKNHVDAVTPRSENPGDVGLDMVAINDGVWAGDGSYIEYDTGIACEVSEGFHIELFPRSSISKMDLSLANSVGLSDQGYRGTMRFRFKPTKRGMRLTTTPEEISIFNFNERLNIYKKGDKIGQLVIRKSEIPTQVIEVKELSSTERGTAGFGSTGV